MDVGDTLIEGWGLVPPAHVALVGGGGKTTLMWALLAAGQLRGWRSVAGTTTRVGAWQVADLDDFRHGGRQGDKLVGQHPEVLDQEFATGAIDLLVIEADGSRRKVVKAPARHEPVIPSTATHVLAVMGADALDRVIEDVAHRPMLVAARCGCSPYHRLTAERAARLMTHADGGRRAVPEGAEFAVALTRIGTRQRDAAERLAALLAAQSVRCFRLPLR